MSKPPYRLARAARKGTASVDVESVDPKTPVKDETAFTDRELPSPDSDRFPKNTISSEDNAKSGEKAIPAITHPGDWAKAKGFSDTVKI